MFAVQLIAGLIFGAICAAIAASKGRSAVGWFFVGFLIGLIGLIIILCMSNLNEEKEQRRWTERERRRLREQLRQERMKNESFRRHATARLDVHDNQLGIDSRSVNVLPDGDPAHALENLNQPQLDARSAPPMPVGGEAVWHYELNGQPVGPINARVLREMVSSGKLTARSLVWREGFADWKSIADVPDLNTGRGA